MRSVRAVPLLLAFAAGLHLAALPSHVEEGAAVAAFFLLTAVGQLVAAFVVHRGAAPPTRALIAAANVGVVAVWAVSRTVGLPLFGHDGGVEPVSLLDALSVAAELAIVAGLSFRSVAAGSRSGARLAGIPALTVVALLVAGAGLPFAPAEHAHAETPVEAHVHTHDAAHHHDH